MSYLVTGIQASPANGSTHESDYSISHAQAPQQGVAAASHGDVFALSGGDKTASASQAAAEPGSSSQSSAQTDAASRKPDTVKLSLAEAVRSLRREGETDVQIAERLNLSTKEVDQHLYVLTNFPALLSTAAANGNGSPATASAPAIDSAALHVAVTASHAA